MSAADLAIRAAQEQRRVGGSDTARLQQMHVDALRALTCLYLAADEHVADDVNAKVKAVLDAQALALRTVREERDKERDNLAQALDHCTEELLPSLRADVERLTAERDEFKRLTGEAEGKVVDLLTDVEHADLQVRALRASIEQLPRHDLSVTAYYPEQAIPKMTVAEKVVKWAELSALLAAIKEPSTP